MERRVLVAIFLSFLVLYAYQTFVVKPPPKPPAVAATNVSGPAATAVPGPATTPGAPGAGVATGPAGAPSATGAEAAMAVPPSGVTPLVGDTAERDVRVETRDVIAVFTNRGARLKSWRLKHYLSQTTKQPQELVATELPSQPLPFTLRAGDDKTTATLNGALYQVSGDTSAAQSSATLLTFEYSDSAGLHAIKEFRLEPSSFLLSFRATVSDRDHALAPAIEWGPAVGDQVAETSRYIQKPEGLLYQNGSVERLATKNIAKQSVYEGDFRYAGVDDHYFMTVLLQPGPMKIAYQPISIPPPPGSKESARDLVAFSVEPSKIGAPLSFFLGPKDFDVLAGIDRELVRAIDFGWFAVLVVPLLRSLKWINGYVGNYGWSIIILTVLINAIMFPLRHKSVVSMRKMQEIQPEVKSIQDRYAKLKATDPAKQKMNTELMELYKARGVNPASGCVPMILTFPVLFAFYSLLSKAIELRGAPFVFWIHDLSLHDPYYVTPILMGASQVWQQKMTPMTGGDPAQQRMMMVMPIVFTFMFLWAPSGVAIYWAVSNIWGIGQQYLTNYLIGPPVVRNVRPAAERRIKKVGGGKTEAAATEKP